MLWALSVVSCSVWIVLHDEVLAVRRALEFAESTILKGDYANAWELSHPDFRSTGTLSDFSSAFERIHESFSRATIRATDYEFASEDELMVVVYGDTVGHDTTLHFSFVMYGSKRKDYGLYSFSSSFSGFGRRQASLKEYSVPLVIGPT